MNRNYIASELLKAAKEMTGSDETNPHIIFSTIHTKLVKAVASGRLDAQKLARQEMVNRGLVKNGRWVGFDEAARQWRV